MPVVLVSGFAKSHKLLPSDVQAMARWPPAQGVVTSVLRSREQDEPKEQQS